MPSGKRAHAVGRILHRVQPLDGEKAPVRATGARRAIVRRRSAPRRRRPADRAMSVTQSRQIPLEDAPSRRALGVRSGLVVIDHIAPSQSAVEHARYIEVPEEMASEWSAAMPNERIVAPHAIRDERVDVQIDQLAASRKLHGVKRASNRRVRARAHRRRRLRRSCASAIPLRPSPDCHRRPHLVSRPDSQQESSSRHATIAGSVPGRRWRGERYVCDQSALGRRSRGRAGVRPRGSP